VGHNATQRISSASRRGIALHFDPLGTAHAATRRAHMRTSQAARAVETYMVCGVVLLGGGCCMARRLDEREDVCRQHVDGVGEAAGAAEGSRCAVCGDGGPQEGHPGAAQRRAGGDPSGAQQDQGAPSPQCSVLRIPVRSRTVARRRGAGLTARSGTPCAKCWSSLLDTSALRWHAATDGRCPHRAAHARGH